MCGIHTQFKKGEHRSLKTEFVKGGIPWNKGKVGVQVSIRKGMKLSPLSKEHREAISKGNIGHVTSQETKDKIALGNKGQKRTPEVRKKMSSIKMGTKQTPETIAKIVARQTGSNNYRWIEDRTKLVKSEKKHLDGRYREWMKAVKNRDNWTCRIADNNCNGRLEAHHILRWSKHPELRYEVNNGISLCHFHHPLEINDEVRLSPYFMELVNQAK